MFKGSFGGKMLERRKEVRGGGVKDPQGLGGAAKSEQLRGRGN